MIIDAYPSRPSFRRWLLLWSPVLVWAGAIYYMSSIPDARPGGSELPEMISRKFAHLVEYAILALLLARALTEGGRSVRRSVAIAFCVCVLYAISDEVHQTFVPGRFGKVRDMALDTLGAGLALSVYFRRSGR